VDAAPQDNSAPDEAPPDAEPSPESFPFRVIYRFDV